MSLLSKNPKSFFRRIILGTFLLILSLVSVGQLGSTQGNLSRATEIFWTDWSSRLINRSDLEGTIIQNLSGDQIISPHGIALDPRSGHVYWAEPSLNAIFRSNLDGSNLIELISNISPPLHIALDITMGHIYWTEAERGQINRSNLDGSSIVALVSGLWNPEFIALDLEAGHLYWTNPSTDEIVRSDLDGENVTSLVSNQSDPVGIAIDSISGHLYWTNFNVGAITRSDLDGSNIRTLVSTTPLGPVDIAIDQMAGFLYWTEQGSGTIKRANLDGSNVVELVSGLSRPYGIALDLELGIQTLPTITSLSPADAAPGDLVTVTGTGFSSNIDNNRVFFDGEEAFVLASTFESITVSVPNVSDGLVNVSVESGGIPSTNSFDINVDSTTAPLPIEQQDFDEGFMVREVLIFFGIGITEQERRDLSNDFGFESLQFDPVTGLAKARLFDGISPNDTRQIVADLNQDSRVFAAFLNSITSSSQFDDPGVGDQEWLFNLGFEYIDEYFPRRGSGVRVAVIDSGLDLDLSDSYSEIIIDPIAPSGLNLADDRADVPTALDFSGHGTIVSSIIASSGSNDFNGTGVAPRARILPIRVFKPFVNDQGITVSLSNVLWVAQALSKAYLMGADVINLSLASRIDGSVDSNGNGFDDIDIVEFYNNLIDRTESSFQFNQLNKNPPILIAATGNDRGGNAPQNSVGCPACLDRVIAVGSVNSDGSRSSFSNFGPQVDFVAQGEGIVATTIGAGFEEIQPGTSFAAPQVAGLAALILGERNFSREQVFSIIKSCFVQDVNVSGLDVETGWGRIVLRPPSEVSNSCRSLTSPPTKIYWTDNADNAIYNANLDGSDVEVLVQETEAPWGIDIDQTNSKMYWVKFTGEPKLLRANLDGSQVEDISNGEGFGSIWDIDVDETTNRLFFTHSGGRRIQRSNLDGSDLVDLISGLDQQPAGIQVDEQNNKLYWTENQSGQIWRANLDGSNIENLISTGLTSPRGLALDLTAGMMYWTDVNADKIQRASINGANIEDLVVGLSSPQGITLDLAEGKMYWTDSSTGKIQRANLDGTEIEDLLTGLSGPYGIALGN